jgi:hypothetical protein
MSSIAANNVDAATVTAASAPASPPAQTTPETPTVLPPPYDVRMATSERVVKEALSMLTSKIQTVEDEIRTKSESLSTSTDAEEKAFLRKEVSQLRDKESKLLDVQTLQLLELKKLREEKVSCSVRHYLSFVCERYIHIFIDRRPSCFRVTIFVITGPRKRHFQASFSSGGSWVAEKRPWSASPFDHGSKAFWSRFSADRHP